MEKVLVIVAHPDDETIWMGGTLLENLKKWDAEIISLCRKEDKDRFPRFKKACRKYRARCFISDLEDENLLPLDAQEIIRRIKKFSRKEYDVIFTHGANGEYGHIRHKEVHNAVIEMIERKMLKAKKLFFFSYKKAGKFAEPARGADKFINLKSESFLMKKKIIEEIYGFEEKSFENESCRNAESFDLK